MAFSDANPPSDHTFFGERIKSLQKEYTTLQNESDNIQRASTQNVVAKHANITAKDALLNVSYRIPVYLERLYSCLLGAV